MSVKSTESILQLRIAGMRCRSCEQLLAEAVSSLSGVKAASASADEGMLTAFVSDDFDLDVLRATVVAQGFVPCDLIGGNGHGAQQPEGEALVVPMPVTHECQDEIPLADGWTEPAEAEAPACRMPAPNPVTVVAPPMPEARESGTTEGGTFVISGMTCASCAAVIDKVLGKTPGVVSANVNLASEKLAVTWDPAVISADGIIAAVKAAGYGAAPLNEAPALSESGHIMLAITGMTCASCQAVIEKTLQRLSGVTSASVNLAIETATVDFDPNTVGPDEIISAVKKAGYCATLKV